MATLLAPTPLITTQLIAPYSGNKYLSDQYGIIKNVAVGDINALVTYGCTVQSVLNNLTATTDPTVTNDNTQDYGASSIWVNTTNGRVWICQGANTGAAAWALSVVPGTGVEPSSNIEQFGSGSGTVLAEGNIYRFVTSPAVTPASTGADIVIGTYILPANSFDGIGNRGMTITAAGSFAANGNNKRIKLWFAATTATVGSAIIGGTAIADTNTVTTSGGGWELQASIFKYGAANSNTQLCLHNQSQVGAAVTALLSPQTTTATENASIIIAVTANASTATTDILFSWMEVNVMN